jgi:predicted DNA-binding protein YlxM (UPF0122 family)
MSERYEWLDERVDELAERYESGQSLREIADAFDVTPPTIHSRLRDHGVEMRNGGPNHRKLADLTSELHKQYVEDDCSIQTIADRYETSVRAARYHLENAGIDCPQRNPRTTDVDWRPFQTSVIKGELLGDGCLHRRRHAESCFFQLSTTTKAHADRLKSKLPAGLFPDAQPNSVTRPNQFTEEDYTCWTVTSRPQPYLDRLYDTWYEVRDEHNRKRVPDDFRLDSTALLHWYWGDGNCSIRDRGAPRVSFATHGFAEPGVRHLQSELDAMGYDNYAVEQQEVDDGSGLYIRLRDYDARTFLDDLRRVNTLPQYDRKFPVPIDD